MGTETTELTEVQTVIDGLSSPTDEQFVQAVRGYSDGAVASAAAKLALEGGGGGGGSLPGWWTVDSTPGAESLQLESTAPAADFATIFQVSGAEGQALVLDSAGELSLFIYDQGAAGFGIEDSSGGTSEKLFYIVANGEVFSVGPTGAVTISPSNPASRVTFDSAGDGYGFEASRGGLAIYGADDAVPPGDGVLDVAINNLVTNLAAFRDGDSGDTLVGIGPTGAVTISPSDEGGLTVREGGDPADGNHVLELLDRDDAGPGSHFDTYGQFTGQAVLLVGSDDSDFASGTLVRAQASSETSQLVALMGPAPDTLEFFIVDENGVTTISPGGTETLKVAVDQLGFFGHAVAAQPEIPATPNAQDIADVLVALGLATQAA